MVLKPKRTRSPERQGIEEQVAKKVELKARDYSKDEDTEEQRQGPEKVEDQWEHQGRVWKRIHRQL